VGLSQARNALLGGGANIQWIFFLVAAFHIVMLSASSALSRLLRLPPPVRKSVLFMGSQKTLPLTLMLQVSLFPEYPLALVVCVLHHLTQLFIDGYLFRYLPNNRSLSKQTD
jgi:sodium/bile acid cotransporter 7